MKDYDITNAMNIGNQTTYKDRRFSKSAERIWIILSWLNRHFSLSEDNKVKRTNYLGYVFYPKWVLGECHHLCMFCEYKYECFSNLDEV